MYFPFAQQLYRCEAWGSHSGEYEDACAPHYDTV
jgi:hypothetical protein